MTIWNKFFTKIFLCFVLLCLLFYFAAIHSIAMHFSRATFLNWHPQQGDTSYAKNINKTQVKSIDSVKHNGQQNKSDNKFNGMQNISIRVERATTANAPDHHHNSPNHLRPPHLFSKANTA